MNYQLFGIRHHGPGSARSLRQALEQMQPDLLLIEGPPEGDALLELCREPQMQPPVALLVYAPENPQQSVYYPYALYSPEWQAIRFAQEGNIPVRFMDLPPAHRMAMEVVQQQADLPHDAEEQAEEISPLRADPLSLLAQAAGYQESELWWEQMVEARRDSTTLFPAIAEAMTALRDELDKSEPRQPIAAQLEMLREAHMRNVLRAALAEGYSRIAVVCGAWHMPALAELSQAKQDKALLKGLPRIKTVATWVPWTYGRLTIASGYGAGVEAPGWYEHLWNTPEQVSIRWLTAVAHALRGQGLDTSSAHIIEAVRLAETLAALRGRSQPGLPELNEAAQSVMLFGDPLPLQLIHQQLVVGERLGSVPETTPMTPLRQELSAEQKRLRLKLAASSEELLLDLRKPLDRERSQLLRRLQLLSLDWGVGGERAEGKGTFKERWQLQWQPEFEVRLIEAGRWGNSLIQAASAIAMHQANATAALPELAALAQQAMFAELGDAVQLVMVRLQEEAAVAADTRHLMEALPPLVQLVRYGDARDTDRALVTQVVTGLATRITLGLPLSCAGLDEEAAEGMYHHLQQVHQALRLLDQESLLKDWQAMLAAMSRQHDLHGILHGHCCRLLRDMGAMSDEESAMRLAQALSRGNEPSYGAAWLDGFLRGSGQLLVHDERLWALIDQWLAALSHELFIELVPLLRRTFSSFTLPERRQMGERAARTGVSRPGVVATAGDEESFMHERAARILPFLSRLIGIDP